MSLKMSGLYAVTPDILDTEKLVKNVDLAMQGGARIVQYRNKSADARLATEQASELKKLATQYNSLLIINDDWRLALDVDADGVHVGKEDSSIGTFAEFVACRKAAGRHFLVGVSCYQHIGLAQRYSELGVDYLAFGAVASSSTKPQAVQVPLTHFQIAKKRFTQPIVAIGGITLDNADEVINAGADAIAVVSALFDSEDIRLTAEKFSNLFGKHV